MLGGQPALIKGSDRVTGVASPMGGALADLVIAGIGVTPDIAIAEQCGLTVNNGIITDRQCRTRTQNIFAIGDCVARPWFTTMAASRGSASHNAVEGEDRRGGADRRQGAH